MKTMNTDTTCARLSHCGELTSFRYGDYNIRFRSSPRLQAYTDVKEWDNGYLVVTARYEQVGEMEEYIDLLPILENLFINPSTFLDPIKGVRIDEYEPI